MCTVQKPSVDGKVARLLWLCLRCLTLGAIVRDVSVRVILVSKHCVLAFSRQSDRIYHCMSLGRTDAARVWKGSRFSFLVLLGTMASDVRCTGTLFQVLFLFFAGDSRYAAFLCR